MQFFKTIAANTFWQTLARIVSSGISFFITIVVARLLGVQGYGDLAKITAFVSLFYLAVDLGLNAIFLQMENSEHHFEDLLSFRMFLAFALFLIVGLFGATLPFSPVSGIGYSPLVKLGIGLFSLTFFTRAIVFSTTVIFQKNYLYKFSAFSTILGSLFTLFFIAIFLMLHLPFIFVVGAYVIGSFAEAIISLIFAKKRIFKFSLNIPFIKSMVIKTLPIALMLFLNLVYFRIDMIILSLIQPTKDVAIYDLAYKFFDFLIALPLFLSNSLYPALLATEKNTRIVIPKLIVYTLGFFFLGIIIALPVWFFSPLIALIKPEFSQSTFALRLLILSLPIFFATNILQWIFIAKRRQVFLSFVYFIFLILNVILNIIYIPHFSYVASAIITGVSEAGVLAALLVYSLTKKI
ncbi:MAG TPA: oligosaccharide flippase family protein [Patescibacteria group bacterium]